MGEEGEDLAGLLEAERQRSVTLANDLRKAQVTATLRELDLPVAFAEVVPADLDVTAEGLRDFVARFLPPPAQPASSGAQPEGTPDLSGWARYERAGEMGAGAPGAGKTEIELLLERGMEGLNKLRGRGRDWNHHAPPDDMAQENQDFAAEVNRLNRLHERAVRRGEAAPGGYFQSWGFGGRHDPPPWAYVAEDGIRE